LSDDGFVYTKTFKISQNYTTPVQDVSGNVSNVRIVINISDYFLVGVDVSHHNGKIDWEKVKNAGIDFAIIRCGYGQNFESQDDTTFEYNVSECERLGIPYGIYLYSYAVDTICAESEAEHVLRLIKGHNPEYGIWLDLEDESVKVTNTELANIAEKFLEKLKTNGYKNVGVYANLTWWQLKLTDARFDKYNKWVAQWGSGCTYDKKYIMWQYTNSGSVDGISGNVDMDIFYK
jgi:GH25 family lysozyme M1 (1,4-beta-N-acetylmuramidase)